MDASVEALYVAVLEGRPGVGCTPMRCDGLSTGIEVAAAELGTIVAAQRARRRHFMIRSRARTTCRELIPVSTSVARHSR